MFCVWVFQAQVNWSENTTSPMPLERVFQPAIASHAKHAASSLVRALGARKKYLGHCETLAGACKPAGNVMSWNWCVAMCTERVQVSSSVSTLLLATWFEITSLSKDDRQRGTCVRPPSLHIMRHALKYGLGYVQHILWNGVRTRKVCGIWVESMRVDSSILIFQYIPLYSLH